jgi:aldose 1-epimerase
LRVSTLDHPLNKSYYWFGNHRTGSVTIATGIRQRSFGRTREGGEVTCFTLDAGGGVAVDVLDYGAIVQAIRAPDRAGVAADVVLGYDTIEAYERDRFYLGAVVGRSAGRIAGAAFTLDGRPVRLTANDGANHLHGGARGFGKALWRARPFEDAAGVGVVLAHTSPDGDEGYPGTLDVRVTYTLSADNVLSVGYHAVTDRPTVVNLTQHSYFNLSGMGDVLGHELEVRASAYTPLGTDLIPTGVLALVEGTPMDFRSPRRIGERIEADDVQLRLGVGYDHNFALDGAAGTLRTAARLADPISGRALEVATTEPGMQLYTGNYLDAAGKGGRRYGPRAGVCLETQHYPDAPNQPDFPSTILRPDEELRSRTEFRFSAG